MPMVTITPPLILLLNVSDSTMLTCIGLGGPRLVLTWEKDNITIKTGEIGNDVLQLNFTANIDNFGNYTCNAIIDDMQISQSLLVVGM